MGYGLRVQRVFTYQYAKVRTVVVEGDSIDFLQLDAFEQAIEAAVQILVAEIEPTAG